MSEYSLIVVLQTPVQDMASEAVVGMSAPSAVPQAALRQVSAEQHQDLTTLKMRFGAYDDEHARVRSGGVVRAALQAGTVQGVALMQQSRYVIAAHSSLA